MTGLLEEQLPVIMAADPNLVRFVALVDPTASELYERVGDKAPLFDPATAPPLMVRWLAGLVALPIESDVELPVQRAAVAAAAETFPRRGTEGSLRELLAVFAQTTVMIDESGWVRCEPRPSVPPRMAGDVAPDDSPFAAPPFVRIVVGPTDATEQDLRTVIERELRGDVPYELTIRGRQSQLTEGAKS